MTGPLPLGARCACLFFGAVALMAARRCWFIGDKMLLWIAALAFILTPLFDFILWWQ